MKIPLTIKPQKYYDTETGKPIGEEYWILDADGHEIACMDEEKDARRIAGAVNTTGDLDIEYIEKMEIRNEPSELRYTLQLCEEWFFDNHPLAVLPGTKGPVLVEIRNALTTGKAPSDPADAA